MSNLPIKKIFNYSKKITSSSINYQIFRAAITVGFLTAFVKIVAMGKELAVAWRFGTKDEVDAFFIALIVPAFLANILANSYSAAVIPIYIHVREQEGKEEAQKLLSRVTVWGLGLVTVISILIVASAPLYLSSIATGADANQLELIFYLLCTLVPIVLLSSVNSIWSAVLNAEESFALAGICPIITPAITIIMLVGFQSWGIFALSIGLICGTTLEIAILGIALHRQGIYLLPKWYDFDRHMRELANQYIPIIAGALLICSASPIDQIMAAMLPSGSVAALNYGIRIIASPMSLIATALTAAVTPYFSKMVAVSDWKGIRHTLDRYIRLIFLTTVPLAAFFIVFSEPLVKLCFQRGSFTAEDTYLVAQIQSFSAWQIPFYIGNLLLVRLISSMQLNQVIAQTSGLSLMINTLGNYLFSLILGVKGIALSTTCVYIFSFGYLLFFIKNYLNKIEKYSKL